MKRTTERSRTALALVKMLANLFESYPKAGERGSLATDRATESKPRYHVYMTAMRAVLGLLLLAVPAAADTFGGFSGVDKPYLVNRDKVCKPLKVEAGTASGQPACETVGADVVAKLSIKDPIPQRGAKAAFTASAQGRTLTVTRASGDKVLTWSAIDPIGKIVEVYASQYEDRIAVAYNVRRMGKDTVDVVAFDLLKPGTTPTPPQPDPTTNPTPPPQTEDPKLTKAVGDARKAAKPKALAAWQAVIALDAAHSEAMFRIAAIHAAAKQPADALVQLEALAKSKKPDAIEWLVEARFEPAFAGIRGDAKFRTAVGLDRKATSLYERLMGFGGQWEQNGTSCDKPEVKLVLKRDRNFTLRVKTRCQGMVDDTPFKGLWRIEGTKIVLAFPTRGKATEADESPCAFEPSADEDALRCSLGRDLDFVVLPARR